MGALLEAFGADILDEFGDVSRQKLGAQLSSMTKLPASV